MTLKTDSVDLTRKTFIISVSFPQAQLFLISLSILFLLLLILWLKLFIIYYDENINYNKWYYHSLSILSFESYNYFHTEYHHYLIIIIILFFINNNYYHYYDIYDFYSLLSFTEDSLLVLHWYFYSPLNQNQRDSPTCIHTYEWKY